MTGTLREIDIPSEFVELCGGWAGDTDCMLRAINSTGGLELGTESHRPLNDDDEPMTDMEWQVHIFSCLSCDVGRIVRSIEKRQAEFPDFDTLKRFEDWADQIVDELNEEYGLS